MHSLLKLSGLTLPLVTSAMLVQAKDKSTHSFTKLHLDKHYWSEGANFGDLNRDGKPDAISGPYWWVGPDFTRRSEIYPATTTFVVKNTDGTEQKLPGFEGALGKKNAYSNDNFFSFVHDFNKDGWNDILTFGLPGTPAYVYINPQKEGAHWNRLHVFDAVDNESPTFADITGDGLPEILCNSGGRFGYIEIPYDNLSSKWTFKPISETGPWGKFNHGLGFGDVNGDGRVDILERGGWWEQPATLGTGKMWERRAVAFSPGGGAQMYVYDVNGDNRPDLITSIAAHGYGLGWYEQLTDKNAEGHPIFRDHIFMNKEVSENRYGVTFSQLHAVELADVNRDGLKDIITGKCFWAHGPTGDPEPGAPAVLYWFELVRSDAGKVDWIPHLIDSDSGVGRQIGVADVNSDGFPDFIIGNKKGTFIFINQAKQTSEEEWRRSLPNLAFPEAGQKRIRPEDVIQRTGAIPPSAPSK